MQEKAKGKAVLTVGENDKFISGGGMVSFALDGGRVVFNLNLGAVKASGLKIDPKLQKFAKSTKE